jgi:hypothetical protein
MERFARIFGNRSIIYGKIIITMGKLKKNAIIENIKKKAGHAAGSIKAAIREFLIKVNPGP